MLNSCRVCCIIRKPVTDLLRKVLEDEYRSSTYYTGPSGLQGTLQFATGAAFLIEAGKNVKGFQKKVVPRGKYREEWDCSLLCNVIMYTLLKQKPNMAINTALKGIQTLRNEWYGHCADFYTTDDQVDDFMKDLIPHIQALSPSDDKFEKEIQQIKERGRLQ